MRAEESSAAPGGSRGRVLRRLVTYFTPHVFAVAAGLAMSFAVRFVAGLGGSCRLLCYPPVTVAMGVLGGLLGAQLYRMDHPLPPASPHE